MKGNDAVLKMVELLEAAAVPYMLTGSYASNAYGVARSTKDADFVVEMGPTTIAELVKRFGSDFKLEQQTSFETITATTRYLIHVVNSPFRIELFAVTGDPHDRERFSRRRRQNFLGRQAFLPTAEDIVVTKLRWSKRGSRPKDIADAKNVVTVQGPDLDWPYIEHWCDQHGTRELLEQIRRSTPPIG